MKALPLLFLAIIIGCGSPPKETPTLPKEAFQQLIADNFSFDIPKDWSYVDLTKPDADQKLEEIEKKDPRNVDLLKATRKGADSDVNRAFAIGAYDQAASFADSMSVTRESFPVKSHFNDYIKTVETVMAPIVFAGTQMQWEKTEVEGREAVIFRTDLQISRAEVLTPIFSITFGIREKAYVYVATFSVAAQRKAYAEAIAARAMETFRFKR